MSIAIYRDQALYLQVLRDEVQAATRQALFSLLSEVDPARFSRLSAIERNRFHAAVEDLTQGQKKNNKGEYAKEKQK